MNGAEKIVSILEENDVAFVAGIPGGPILPLYHALAVSSLRHILARHEQGAGFIAQGYARVTGRTGVCIASSGPGATNLITALADAAMDSIPIVAITAQVPRALMGTDAFQEVDTTALAAPVTKAAFLVMDPAELESAVREAFRIAADGRPGPVLIDVPKDVLSAEITESRDVSFGPGRFSGIKPGSAAFRQALESVRREIQTSKRPVLYIGGGVMHERAASALYELAVKCDIPVVSTLLGLGAFPGGHPLFFGMLGMHAAPYTNLLLERADLLLAFGVRFDDRATGKVALFCPTARIVHVDIDADEIGKIRRPDVSAEADLRDFLPALNAVTSEQKRTEWRHESDQIRCDHPIGIPAEISHPVHFLERLSREIGEECIVTTDVGQHQMWTAQAMSFQRPRSLVTSGGLGTMGFGMPAAIGAALGAPDKTIVCITGDGSILMNLQELATLAELDLNVKVLILNNRHLGLVRQQQTLFYEGRIHASSFGNGPDFAAIARGFGLPAGILSGLDINGAIECILKPGPMVIDVPLPEDDLVLPMVPPGAANKDMIRFPSGGVKVVEARG